AFGIDGMEPGDPARAISRGGVVILVYRSEEKNEQELIIRHCVKRQRKQLKEATS
ncbi:DUF4752 family protein, partial [Escherichia coli]|uniref:DUF4752 family protein n=1 Tax=Escherichia coli TaxID=562 RepID=UPI0011E9A7FA